MHSRTNLRGNLIAAAASVAWVGTSPGIRYLLDRGVLSLTIALWRDVAIVMFMVAVLSITNKRLL